MDAGDIGTSTPYRGGGFPVDRPVRRVEKPSRLRHILTWPLRERFSYIEVVGLMVLTDKYRLDEISLRYVGWLAALFVSTVILRIVLSVPEYEAELGMREYVKLAIRKRVRQARVGN